MIIGNREKLRPRADGKFDAGVYIQQDERQNFVAHVYLAMKGPGPDEVYTTLAMDLPPEPTSEGAYEAGRRWALFHLPPIYHLAPGELQVTSSSGRSSRR